MIIIVGSLATGRTQSKFASIVGYFINRVLLRAVLKGEITFKAFLGQMCQTVLEALDHQEYQFSLLLERLQPNRDPSRLFYTSGSTGTPKGAMNTHRGICNRLLWMQDAYQLTEADKVLQKTPFSFDVSI